MHWACGEHSTSPSRTGNDHAALIPGQVWGCPVGKRHCWARPLQEKPSAVLQPGCANPATGTGDRGTALDKRLTSTNHPKAIREFETFVTILEDGISLKNKHSLFKWIRRTSQLNDCLISETRDALSTVITLDCWGKTTELRFLRTQQQSSWSNYSSALLPWILNFSSHRQACGHLVTAAVCFRVCFRNAVSICFPRGKEVIKVKDHRGYRFPCASASTACKPAITHSKDE